MTATSKKKKQTIRREVGLGGCAVILMSPLILLAVLVTFLGIVVSIEFMIDGNIEAGLQALLINAIAMSIFVIIGTLYLRRLRELYRRGRYLSIEQERVNNMLDTASAEKRLADKPSDTTEHIVNDSKRTQHETNN